MLPWRMSLRRPKRLFSLILLLYPILVSSASFSAALSVPASNEWYGNDGTWSANTVRVGSPAQWIDVLPSTSGSETIAIGNLGCDNTTQCRRVRGGLLNMSSSSTWTYKGNFEVALARELGYNAVGTYGYDTVAIGDSVSALSQIVGVVNDTQFWTGVLGLGIKASNFQETKMSLLYSLASGNSSSIPSQSYGYTAGAVYKLKKVPASLTLGGYDSSRLVHNDASFQLDSNQNPTLAVNSISVSGWTGNRNFVLLDSVNAALFTIDSSTPFLWFPEKVCSRFEEVFGLRYDDSLDVYLYQNSSQRSLLENANLTFNFFFSDLPESPSAGISMTITGGALLSHSLSYGFPRWNGTFGTAPQPYFPLRKARNSTQYILGRSFLQEVYLIVDYQRNNFSISQAQFSPNVLGSAKLVDIYPPLDNTTTVEQDSTGPNLPVIIGASVGGSGGLILFSLAVLFCMRRHKRHIKPLPDFNVVEKDAEETHEVHADIIRRELALDEKSLATELPGSRGGKQFVIPFGHSPGCPVELPSDNMVPRPVHELMSASRGGSSSRYTAVNGSPNKYSAVDFAYANASPSTSSSTPPFSPITHSSDVNLSSTHAVSPIISEPPSRQNVPSDMLRAKRN